MKGHPFLYLLLTRVKNQLKTFVKSPGKLIYVILLAACMVIVLMSGKEMAAERGNEFRNISELIGGAVGVYTIMFCLVSVGGFGNGGSMFRMPDVNLMFVAPHRSQTILFYGLIQQVYTSLLIGVFLLFQYGTLHSVYGISVGFMVLLMLGFALSVFFGQMFAMVLYIITSGSDEKKKAGKIIFYGLIFAFAAAVIYFSRGEEGITFIQVLTTLQEPVGMAFPVAGWTGILFKGVATGNLLFLILGIGLLVLAAAGIILFIVFCEPDFYEDVIKSAEVMQSAIAAQKSGSVVEATPQKVKLGKEGIRQGFGANTFFYKHMLENRRARVVILSMMSFIFSIVSIVMALMMKSIGIMAVFAMITYMQIFTVAQGRFNYELLKPYVYLVPEPPIKKMIWGLMEQIPSATLEALVILIPVGIVMKMSPLLIILAIIARLSYAWLFSAGNILMMRLWGGVASKALSMFLFIMVMLVSSLPGIFLGVAMISIFPAIPMEVLLFLSMTGGNLLLGLLLLFLCRNMLQYAELNNR